MQQSLPTQVTCDEKTSQKEVNVTEQVWKEENMHYLQRQTFKERT